MYNSIDKHKCVFLQEFLTLSKNVQNISSKKGIHLNDNVKVPRYKMRIDLQSYRL